MGQWKLHEFGDLNLSFLKKQGGTAQIIPSIHVFPSAADKKTTLDFHAERLAKVHANEQTLEDAPGNAGTELRHSGEC